MRNSKPSDTMSRLTGQRRQLSLPFKSDSKPSRALTASLKPLPVATISQKIASWVPHKYQQIAVKWLLQHPEAALLLDLGLGKTSIFLEAFRGLRAAGGAHRALVVAPRRPAQLVWSQSGEVGKWAQFANLKVALLHGKDKDKTLDEVTDADLYVINYEGLAWLAKRKGFQLLLKRGVDVLIIDELSKVRNYRSLRARLVWPWLPKFRRRWGGTGSPAPKSLLDLFGEVRTLDLGRRLGKFITRYRNRWFYPTGFGGFEWLPKEGAEKEIMAAIRDLALAMRSEDHLDLPPLVERDVWVDLPDAARKAYDELEKELITVIDSGAVTAKNAAVAASKCAQVASGGVYQHQLPEVLHMAGGGIAAGNSGRKTIHVHDEKTAALVDLVEERQGSPLLVLYDFQHDLERIQAAFDNKLPVIGGGTSDKLAGTLIQQWNRGELPVLLGHPGSVGIGLNMQAAGCGHICFYTVPWDREYYDQTIGRIRRQGVTAKRIVVHRLLARDTVDEAKVKVLAAKNRTQRAVFDALISLCTKRHQRVTLMGRD